MPGSRFERIAVELAERGYHVFPTKPGDKPPLTPNGFHDARVVERTILRWWDRWPNANPAVACGASGINVLDLDSKNGCLPSKAISQLKLEHYPIVQTGVAGPPTEKHPDSIEGVRGAQVWFRGELRTCELGIRGTEIRGNGGYVLAPGAIHPTGVEYVTNGKLPRASELPPLPDQVRHLPRKDGGSAEKRERVEPRVFIELVRDGVGEGGRRKSALRLIGHLLHPPRKGVHVDVIRDLMLLWAEHRCDPPLTPEQIDRLIEDVCLAQKRNNPTDFQ